MLVRFQRLRVALVAAQMFCIAYINTEEFPFLRQDTHNLRSVRVRENDCLHQNVHVRG